MNIQFSTKKSFAKKLDANDPLKNFRKQFLIPKSEDGKDLIYLCGNSLGLQPKAVKKSILQELKDWKQLGVEGHFAAKFPWKDYHEFLTEPMARIVGAKPEEVVVMGTLTANLHLLMVSFFNPTKEKYKIIIEKDAFPSDKYAVVSQLKFHGFDSSKGLIELSSRSGNPVIPTQEILETIENVGNETAMILLGGVNYYSGQAFEMEKITKAAHAKGIVVGFDLAHAAGNLKLDLHNWGVDFAAWCGYKYLNGGPGGVAGIFVHQKHIQNKNINRFAGWWGHDKNSRFKMGPEFVPIPTAESWQLSNAPVMAMACLRPSLELFEEAGMERLNEKSELLTTYLEFLLQPLLPKLHLELITPADFSQRGCQLSLRTLHNGIEIFNLLALNGVICDWREPDVIRIAAVPMYNSFMDCWKFASILKALVEIKSKN